MINQVFIKTILGFIVSNVVYYLVKKYLCKPNQRDELCSNQRDELCSNNQKKEHLEPPEIKYNLRPRKQSNPCRDKHRGLEKITNREELYLVLMEGVKDE